MSYKSDGKTAGYEEKTRNLVEKIEDERKKLEDVGLTELSRPEVIGRQQAFDKAVVEFMRKRLAKEKDQED